MPENLNLVRIGLYLVLASILVSLLLFLAIVLSITTHNMAIMLVIGSLGLLGMLACPALGFLGRLLCLAAPADSGVREPLIVALAIDAVTFGLGLTGSQWFSLAGLAAVLLFLLSLSRLATYLERPDIAGLVRETVWLPLLGGLCIFGGFFLIFMAGAAVAMGVSLLGTVLMLLGALRYVRVLSMLAGAIAQRG